MLRAVPLRNAAAVATPTQDGKRLDVAVPTRRPAYLIAPISWIVKPPGTRIMQLDFVGASVWELCDGSRTVEQIIAEFAGAHGLTFHESRVSVTGYIKLLVRHGVLAMAMQAVPPRRRETEDLDP
jgi:hypothetical protein